MKFLLVAINAKYIHSNPAVYSLPAYVGAGLREHVEIAEYTINSRMEDILSDIYRRKPQVIGISCYIWNWRLVKELLGELPKLLPGVPVWLGGPEVSFEPERILAENPSLTGIMVGEGEETFRELLDYYTEREGKAGGADNTEKTGNADNTEKAGSADNTGNAGSADNAGNAGRAAGLRSIPGLCLAGGYTPPREPADMSALPFLYEDAKQFANRIIYYESSRGCPYQCSYCLSSIDRRVRLRDISVVKRELQFFLDAGVPQVKFVDRTFNCNHEHAMAVWRYLHEHDNNVTNFHFEISADLLRKDELALLRRLRPGQVQLEIGVQSTNPQTLEAIRRMADLDKLERAVAAVREGGNIHQHLDLIAGLPFEDYRSFRRSFNRVYAMRPQQLQLGFLKVLKGSPMYEEAERYGIRYLSNPPYEVLFTDWLSYDEMIRLKAVEEMVERYYNSGQFSHTLLFLERAFPTPFDLFESMADFYKEKGYFMEHPARAYRYQALLEFAEYRDGGNAAVYRELLIYDMYLRENLKSRPDFAEDQASHREEIRRFYRDEALRRRYLPDYGEYDWKQASRMTHLEYFRYPVWDMDDKGGGFVLFDYGTRDPLSREARTVLLDSRSERIVALPGKENAW